MITRKQSKALQGLAILLMMYHHFFSYPEIIDYTFWNVNLARNIAWFGKICVGLFAFVSGYGIYYCMEKIRKANKKYLGKEYKDILVRLLKLLCKYWYIVILHVVIGVFIFKDQTTSTEFLKNFFVINQSYNGSWWYMRIYLLMLILAPILDWYLEALKIKGKNIVCIIALLGILAAMKILPDKYLIFEFINYQIQPTFVAVFVVGFLLAKLGIYEKINGLTNKNRVIELIIGSAITIIAVAVRVLLSTEPAYAKFDFVIVPVFVLGILLVIKESKICNYVLGTLGTYSTFMWLIHADIYGRTYDLILKYINNAFAFFVIQLILSFVFAVIIQWVYDKINNKFIRKNNKK